MCGLVSDADSSEWSDDEHYAQQYAEEINGDRNPENILSFADDDASKHSARESKNDSNRNDNDNNNNGSNQNSLLDDADDIPALEERN